MGERPRFCPECDAGEGVLHEPFCSKERCPFCSGQLAPCGCAVAVLGLSAEEQRVFEEYEDDTVEPLRSIVARWDNALEAKGRVPFWLASRAGDAFYEPAQVKPPLTE